VAAPLLGLLEREPVWCLEALGDQEKDVDAALRPTAYEIARWEDRAALGLPGLLPGDDSLLQQGEDTIGHELIDLLTH